MGYPPSPLVHHFHNHHHHHESDLRLFKDGQGNVLWGNQWLRLKTNPTDLFNPFILRLDLTIGKFPLSIGSNGFITNKIAEMKWLKETPL
jgi:hypothetical protein